MLTGSILRILWALCQLGFGAFLIPLLSGSQPLLKAPDPIPITIEHAVTEAEQTWGLMQRTSLPERHGMLFSYAEPRQITLWSFNCLMDLSVAFIDQFGAIQEIATLKAYPQMMDPQRPVKTLRDLTKYSPEDPIRSFYRAHRIASTLPCCYALEMPPSFFSDQKIDSGDVVYWKNQEAFILHRVDLSPYVNECTFPIKITLEESKPIALRALKCPGDFVINFYDSQKKLIQRALLHSKRTAQSGAISVFCKQPVAELSIAPLVRHRN